MPNRVSAGVMDPEADKPESRTLLESWWRLSPRMRVWMVVTIPGGVVTFLSIADFVVELHGFVVDGLVFYHWLRDPVAVFVSNLLGVRLPVVLFDAYALYLLVTSVFLRTVGAKNAPGMRLVPAPVRRAIQRRRARSNPRARAIGDVIAVVVGPFGAACAVPWFAGFVLWSVPNLQDSHTFQLLEDDWRAATLFVLANFAVGYLATPGWRALRRRDNELRMQAALFYGWLAAILLLFGSLAGVSAGVSQIEW